jgi:NTP pyrophosphatase (non-canonical NTP hydrolase)
MTFNEFQDSVNRTWNFDYFVLSPWQVQVLLAELGLSGETGELSEALKKGMFHGLPDQMSKDKIKKELGDVLYYLTKAADLFGLSLEDVADTNNKKLQARYPNGFVPGGGVRTGEGA